MSDKEIYKAARERLAEIEYDRGVVKAHIRHTSDKDVIRALRRLNNVLERTEIALNNV